MDDDFGVRVGAERVTAREQFGADLGEVVNLAVEDDLDRAVLVRERLIARGQIDDAQAPMAEADARRRGNSPRHQGRGGTPHRSSPPAGDGRPASWRS